VKNNTIKQAFGKSKNDAWRWSEKKVYESEAPIAKKLRKCDL
jgi:hypothetical protein